MSDLTADTLYFVLVDRFDKGGDTPSKDKDLDSGRSDWSKFWGGDLPGIIQRLDHLQSLGIRTVVCSPIFEQREGIDEGHRGRIAPYHGYAAQDLRRIDKHFSGSGLAVRPFTSELTVFDALLEAVHARGMRLVLDVVAHLPPGVYALFDDGKPWARHDGSAWVHTDTGEAFDEESLLFRSYLRGVLRDWLARGVDGFRLSSVKHLPLWFWQELTADLRADYPLVLLFGEWYLGGGWDAGSIDFANRSGMTILDFGWRNAVVSALARRSLRGFQELAELLDRDTEFHHAAGLVTFIDSHDFPRFLSILNDEECFRVAVLLTIVGRGIPCLFYGGEQAIHCDIHRGNDPYNRPMLSTFQHTPLGNDIAALSQVRASNAAIQKGGLRIKYLDADRMAFTRSWLGHHALVAVNRLDEVADFGLTGVELPDGHYADALGGDAVQVQDGAVRIKVPARGIVVYHIQTPVTPPLEGSCIVDIVVQGVRTQFGETLCVVGSTAELGEWDVERAVPMEYIDTNTWGTTVAFAERGTEVTYKFLWQVKEEQLRETGPAHRRLVPGLGTQTARWRDDWWK